MSSRFTYVALFVAALPTIIGCGSGDAKFTQNKIAARATEINLASGDPLSRNLRQQVADILGAVFGTPDEPKIVAGGAEVGFVSAENLSRAAGPVTNERLSGEIDATNPHLSKGQGLYRQHCVHCHGINGDGKGPTAAFLNPYPRDFTLGVFKFNSTTGNTPSTHEDLHRILMNGINGTAMPSFALLDSGEVEALVDYVKYLSVRGQSERFLLERAIDVLGEEPEEMEVSAEAIIGDPDDEGISEIISRWTAAETEVNPTDPSFPIVTTNPADWSDEEKQELFASVERGRQLYYSKEALCSTCHGETQLGDGNLGLYDAWTKEMFDFQATPDEDGSKTAEYMDYGGLEPRNIMPRNLRLGQYRGGRRPLDIFWRIRNGISGSGMPAASAGVLPDEKVWDLVNFVLYLPYEQMSRPSIKLETLDRARD